MLGIRDILMRIRTTFLPKFYVKNVARRQILLYGISKLLYVYFYLSSLLSYVYVKCVKINHSSCSNGECYLPGCLLISTTTTGDLTTFILQALFQSAQLVYEKREGPGSGSVPLTNGYGSGFRRPKKCGSGSGSVSGSSTLVGTKSLMK